MYICIYVYVYVYIHIHKCACVCVCVSVCLCVCLPVCLCACVSVDVCYGPAKAMAFARVVCSVCDGVRAGGAHVLHSLPEEPPLGVAASLHGIREWYSGVRCGADLTDGLPSCVHSCDLGDAVGYRAGTPDYRY